MSAFGGGQNCAETDVSTALSAHPGGSRLDFQTETFVAFHPKQDPISSAGVCHAIGANANATAAVEFTQNSRSEVRHIGGDGHIVGALAADAGAQQQNYLATAMKVRRLTPRECERLQGFPDGYTAIPWRGKPASECPDGPRYKALGNSWAVPCVRWIGRRIHEFMK